MKFSIAVLVFFGVVSVSSQVLACSVKHIPPPEELVASSSIIIWASAQKYEVPPANSNVRSTGRPNSIVSFKVEEVIKGTGVPAVVHLPGYLSEYDDYNDHDPPYTFVRPGGCSANTYRQGGHFLLFLVSYEGNITLHGSALTPRNEQISGKDDRWLLWVKEHLAKEAEGLH